MYGKNAYLYERLMHQRVHERLRRAKLRQLQRQAAATGEVWLKRSTSRMLDPIGSLFVSIGKHLKRKSRVLRGATQKHVDSRA
jgi:hypothetical protein